jgi:predicted DNA-binding antitoxin AbrB/MazE fold protein
MTLTPRLTGKSGRKLSDTPDVLDTDTPDEEYRVGPGCPPKQFQFKPGESGNPMGAKLRKPSIAPDLKALFKRALSKKVKLRQGEKEQIVTKAAAGIEQLVNQFAKGDRHARRDLITVADKLGVDLGAGERNAIEEALAANYQTILDAYTARQKDAPSRFSPVLAPPELLDDDSENSKSE